MATSESISTLDEAIVVAYFCFIFAVGLGAKHLFACLLASDEDEHEAEAPCDGEPPVHGSKAQEYFLAKRDTPWWAVACSFFASNIGTDAIVGTAGAAAASGIPVALFDWGSATVSFTALAFLFLPAYFKANVFTLPEFLQKAYGNRVRTYIAWVSLLIYTARVGSSLYAGAVITEEVMGWGTFSSLLSLVLATGVYTMVGGLYSVIVTEIVQTAVLVCAAFITCGVALERVGGWHALEDKVPGRWLTLLHDGSGFDLHPYPYRWFSMVLGMPFLTLFFHCADQEMVQRGLSARNLREGQKGCIAGGYLKIVPPLMFVFPGVIARVLDHEKGWGDLGCAEEFSGPCTSADRAFPMLVRRLLPSGLRGIVLASMLAALMSSMSAVFNSSSTIFTMDIYPTLRKSRPPVEGGAEARAAHAEREDNRTVLVGRLVAGASCIIGMMWVPVLQVMPAGLYDFIQSLAAAVGPPILVTYAAAVIYPGAVHEGGAVAGLAAGHGVALLLLLLRGVGAARGGWLAGLLDDYVLSAVFPATATTLVFLAEGVLGARQKRGEGGAAPPHAGGDIDGAGDDNGPLLPLGPVETRAAAAPSSAGEGGTTGGRSGWRGNPTYEQLQEPAAGGGGQGDAEEGGSPPGGGGAAQDSEADGDPDNKPGPQLVGATVALWGIVVALVVAFK